MQVFLECSDGNLEPTSQQVGMRCNASGFLLQGKLAHNIIELYP